MNETNDGAVRIVPREEKMLRVFQLVPSKKSCRHCAWDSSCGERTIAFKRTGCKRGQCSAISRADATSQIMKEI